MKQQHPQNQQQHNQHGHVPSGQGHPWLTTLCVLCGLGIVALAVFWIRRCKSSNIPRSTSRSRSRSRHEYHAVRSSSLTFPECEKHDDLDLELKQFQKHLNRTTNRYQLTANLGQMGWRPGKQWFLLRDTALQANRLLTLVDLPPATPIQPNAETRLLLHDLVHALHHPYILPILDIAFWEGLGAVVVTPFNGHAHGSGSLKDLIYQNSTCFDTYTRKYGEGRGEGLPFRQVQKFSKNCPIFSEIFSRFFFLLVFFKVQCLSRQILEALSFLERRNFPKFYHLHSGNVIVQNGVARLAGVENTLFCLEAKTYYVSDAVAFGHLLFEMTTGYELSATHCTSSTMLHCKHTQVADVLDMIFDPSMPPSIDTLIRHDMFKGVELRELCRASSLSSSYAHLQVLSQDAVDLLSLIADRDRDRQPSMLLDGQSAEATTTTSTSDNDGIEMAPVDQEQPIDAPKRPLDLFHEFNSDDDETLTVIIETNLSSR